MSMKPCQMCTEPIAEAARKCPHCHSLQSRFRWMSDTRDPRHTLVALGITALLFMPIVFLLTRLTDRNPSPAGLRIISSRLSPVAERDRDYVVILGTIENTSQRRMRNLHFQVDCFSHDGTLVDTYAKEDYDLVIAAHGRTNFRLLFPAAAAPSEYQRHVVTVTASVRD